MGKGKGNRWIPDRKGDVDRAGKKKNKREKGESSPVANVRSRVRTFTSTVLRRLDVRLGRGGSTTRLLDPVETKRRRERLAEERDLDVRPRVVGRVVVTDPKEEGTCADDACNLQQDSKIGNEIIEEA